MREDPPADTRCRDKFLVQSVAITPDRDLANITDTVRPFQILASLLAYSMQWAIVEKGSKDDIQERKIRVVFLPSDGSTAAAATPNHNNINGFVSHLKYILPSITQKNQQYHSDEAPPAYASPDTSFISHSATAPLNQAAEGYGGAASQGGSRLSEYRDSSDVKENATSVASNIKSTLGSVAAGISNAAPKSGEESHKQPDQTTGTDSSLKNQVEEQVLKQRKSDVVNQDSRERITTGTTGMGIQQQPADGVPVQIVAALCLLSFLLAYFFF